MIAQRLWQAVLSRDQWIVAAAMALAIAIAWASLLSMGVPPAPSGTAQMPGMASMPGMQASGSWTASYGALVFAMWSIMMVAMMLPSAAPMILLYARVAGQGGARPTLAPTSLFAGTYLTLWLAFASVAALAQWALSHAHLLSNSTMAIGSNRIGGAILIAVGIYQLTPLKRTCLENCRSPFSFLTAYWRPGVWGAVRLGLIHGAYCVGCCWLLMALLFVGGAMNLIWVAAIAAIVLIEKVAPAGQRIGRVAGAIAIVAGMVLIAAAGAT